MSVTTGADASREQTKQNGKQKHEFRNKQKATSDLSPKEQKKLVKEEEKARTKKELEEAKKVFFAKGEVHIENENPFSVSHTTKVGYFGVVTKNDTVNKIAIQYYGAETSSAYIILANKLKNPDKIKVGQVLYVPDLIHVKNPDGTIITTYVEVNLDALKSEYSKKPIFTKITLKQNQSYLTYQIYKDGESRVYKIKVTPITLSSGTKAGIGVSTTWGIYDIGLALSNGQTKTRLVVKGTNYIVTAGKAVFGRNVTRIGITKAEIELAAKAARSNWIIGAACVATSTLIDSDGRWQQIAVNAIDNTTKLAATFVLSNLATKGLVALGSRVLVSAGIGCAAGSEVPLVGNIVGFIAGLVIGIGLEYLDQGIRDNTKIKYYSTNM